MRLAENICLFISMCQTLRNRRVRLLLFKVFVASSMEHSVCVLPCMSHVDSLAKGIGGYTVIRMCF